MGDLHHFHLVELVLADHAARVPAVGTRLERKHGVWATNLSGRLSSGTISSRTMLVTGTSAVGIRYSFSVSLFWTANRSASNLGNCPCRASNRRSPDKERKPRIAVLLGMHIEHELSQRPVQPRKLATHHRETRPADFCSRAEIQLVQPSPTSTWSLTGKIEGARRAYPTHFHIVILGFAGGRGFVRQVGMVRRISFILPGCLPDSIRQLSARRPDWPLPHDGADILALGLGLANLLGSGIALRLQLLGAGLDRLALHLKRLEGGRIEHETRVAKLFVTPSRSLRSNCMSSMKYSPLFPVLCFLVQFPQMRQPFADLAFQSTRRGPVELDARHFFRE